MFSNRFGKIYMVSVILAGTFLLNGCAGDKGYQNSVPTPPAEPQPREESAFDQRVKEYEDKKAKEEADFQAKVAAGDPEAIKLKNDLAEIEAMKKENAPAEADKNQPVAAEGTVMKFETAPEGEAVQIFKVGNDNAVSNGGTPPAFSTNKAYWLKDLWTYHWNGGQGQAAGTIAIQSADGTLYGPWQAELNNGVYWVARPGVTLPAGSYTVIDSNPSTLAQNGGTGGQGMAWANGIEVQQ